MTLQEPLCVQHTKQWIQSVVIELNLCPFAKREMDRGAALFQVSAAPTAEQALADLVSAVEALNTNPAIETLFLVFPTTLVHFMDYLDYVDQATTYLSQNGYDGIYQLATFHPHYCFAGVPTNDVTNYTNRSPYPMLHFLREDSLEQAIAFYGNTEMIPEKNMARLRQLGTDNVKHRLQRCFF